MEGWSGNGIASLGAQMDCGRQGEEQVLRTERGTRLGTYMERGKPTLQPPPLRVPILSPSPHPRLTVCAGAALPAIPTDAGERVTAAHTGAPIHAGVGQAAAVLGCEKGEGAVVSSGQIPNTGRARQGRAAGEGLCRLLTNGAGAALPAWWAGAAEGVPTIVARATITAGVGVTLELACGYKAAQWADRMVAGSPPAPPLACRGPGHSREWQVLPFHPSSQAQ